MTSTSHLRQAWAPACTGPFARVALHGDGTIMVRATTVEAWNALNTCLIAHDYRTRKADTGAYNCRRITGGTGYSLHAYGIAADLNWQTNPYGPRLATDMPSALIDAVKRIRTRNGQRVFRWGGDYATNKDAMHFEIICDPADLATGIDATTLPGSTPVTPDPTLEIDMATAAELERKIAEQTTRLDVFAAWATKATAELRQRDDIIIGWAKGRLNATDDDVAELRQALAGLATPPKG